MKRLRCKQGFALIELIFFMVVVSLAIAGIVPLVNQVFSNLHVATEQAQGYFLVQGVLEQIDARNAGGEPFDVIINDINITGSGCKKPDGTLWENGFPWRCQVEGYVAQNQKSVIVTISHIDTNEVVFRDDDTIPRVGYP